MICFFFLIQFFRTEKLYQKGENMKKGFTLIELLVVVLIIGILSAVALPQYQKTVFKARAAEAEIWVSNAAKAAELYQLENPDGNLWIRQGEYDSDSEGDLSIDLPILKDWICEIEIYPAFDNGYVSHDKDWHVECVYRTKENTYAASIGRYTFWNKGDPYCKPFGAGYGYGDGAACKVLGYSCPSDKWGNLYFKC